MNRIKRIACAVAAAVFLSVSVFAEQDSREIYIWNGSTKFFGQSDYSVRTAVEITENLTIPEGMTLYIRSDGVLTVSEGVTLTINGSLKINSGGTLRCFGSIKSETGSVLNDYGTLVIRENSTLEVSGDINIFSDGLLNVLGSVITSPTSYFYVSGNAYFRESSTFEHSGELRIGESGFFRFSNGLTSLENSLIRNFGHIAVESDLTLGGELKNAAEISGSGRIILSRFLSFKDGGNITAQIVKPPLKLVDGAAYFGEVLMINRQYPLPESYPATQIDPDALSALERMREESGFPMTILSGYRSYQYQVTTYTHWCNVYGVAAANMISAPPGASEHQSGLAFDLSYLNQGYIDTAEGRWLRDNAHKYGFIVRFVKDKKEYTGYSYEPWHIRYLGVELATMVYESGLSLEEFVGLPPIVEEQTPRA